jgi:hypothetical protein
LLLFCFTRCRTHHVTKESSIHLKWYLNLFLLYSTEKRLHSFVMNSNLFTTNPQAKVKVQSLLNKRNWCPSTMLLTFLVFLFLQIMCITEIRGRWTKLVKLVRQKTLKERPHSQYSSIFSSSRKTTFRPKLEKIYFQVHWKCSILCCHVVHMLNYRPQKCDNFV